MKLVIIDNYDSFTFNLYQMLQPLMPEPIKVFRNDQITIDELAELRPSHVVMSPGPGHPANDADFGVCKHFRQEEIKCRNSRGLSGTSRHSSSSWRQGDSSAADSAW